MLAGNFANFQFMRLPNVRGMIFSVLPILTVFVAPFFGIVFFFLLFGPVLESPKPEPGQNGNGQGIQDIIIHTLIMPPRSG